MVWAEDMLLPAIAGCATIFTSSKERHPPLLTSHLKI
jgi:hypothetical protein